MSATRSRCAVENDMTEAMEDKQQHTQAAPQDGEEAQPQVHFLKIKDMDSDDTPRERAEKYGVGVLAVADLWALILRTGIVGKPITELCRDMMRDNDGKLTRLERRSRAELLNIKGMGRLKALQVEAVMELIRRYNSEEPAPNPRVASSGDIFRIMRPRIGNLPHEEIWALLLNRRHECVKCMQISKGGMSSTVFDVRLLLREALLENATSVAICHNHPSGTREPSVQDDQLTRRCKEACAQLDIRLIDHIIVTNHNTTYYSYCDEGRL